jgi:uncharacterized protein
MRDFRDAKAMAQTLREALNVKSVSLTHSESLELVAKVLGFRDWNVLAARIQESPPTAAETAISATILSSSSPLTSIPVFPMRDLVLFPQMVAPIFVGRDKTRRAVECAMAGDRRVLVVAQRRGTEDDPGTLESLFPVGVMASVINRQTQVNGVLKVFVSGLQRTAIARLINDEYLSAEALPVEEENGQSGEAATLSRAVLDAYQAYDTDFSALPQGLKPPQGLKSRLGLPSAGDPSLLADTVAQLLSIGLEQKQQLLETSDVVTRLQTILDWMSAGRSAK